MEAETNRIPCDYCGKEIIIPEYPTQENSVVLASENTVMLVTLCLFCGAINDLFYEFREITAGDYMTKEPPWKDEADYKQSVKRTEKMRKEKGIDEWPPKLIISNG